MSKKMSHRQYDQMALRGQIYLSVEDFLFKRYYKYTSADLWRQALTNEQRAVINKATFYRWLRKWASEGRLEATKITNRGWFVQHRFQIPEDRRYIEPGVSVVRAD